MKLTKKRVLFTVGVLGVSITGVFGGVAAGLFGPVVAGNIFSYQYWKSVCINRTAYYENLSSLRKTLKVTPLEEEDKNASSTEKKDRLEKHSFAFFLHREVRVVPGPDVRGNFEGNPDDPIDLINYDIACRYPPHSVFPSGNAQVIGAPPAILPAYCHEPTPMPSPSSTPYTSSTPSPTPCPSPSPNGPPTYSYAYCAVPVPSPIPPVLSMAGLGQKHPGQDVPFSDLLGSVGAFTVQVNNAPVEIWGSGFMIADHIFATSCHVLEPLLKKDPKTGVLTLKDEFKDKLYANFDPFYLNPRYKNLKQLSTPQSAKPEQASSLEFKADYLDCSEQRGLDVAFLSLDSSRSTPHAVTLFYARDKSGLDIFRAKPAALITYIDLLHPLDEITSEMYQCFANPEDLFCQPAAPSPTPTPTPYQEYVGFGKFAMIDGIVAPETCGGVHLLLDTADTSVGASGALVVDIFKSVDPYIFRKIPLAVGLHKCCAAYFGEEGSYGPPSSLPCADLKRTPINQDVSTKSIIDDPRLCKYLQQKQVIAKLDDNTDYPITCSN